MAESSVMHDGDVIIPYNFAPDGLWSSSEESDGNINDNDSQASFTEHLGNTLWCTCVKCVTMPRTIECTCCRELSEVEERLEETSTCITSSEAFKIVSLDKDVLYTSLVTIHMVRGDKVRTPISNR